MFIESKSCACHEVYQDDFPGHQQIHQVKILYNDGGGAGVNVLYPSCLSYQIGFSADKLFGCSDRYKMFGVFFLEIGLNVRYIRRFGWYKYWALFSAKTSRRAKWAPVRRESLPEHKIFRLFAVFIARAAEKILYPRFGVAFCDQKGFQIFPTLTEFGI